MPGRVLAGSSKWALVEGDSAQVLRGLPANSIHACVCDPPSGITMFGRKGAPRPNVHPTCKPVTLMRWLVRLVCPVGGVVLDPFAGSGTTGVAALAEGMRFIGVEKEADYTPIALARLQHAHPQEVPPLDLALDGFA